MPHVIADTTTRCPQSKAYLLLWNLLVLVGVQSFEQVGRSVSEPHEQVARGDSLLEAHQLNFKDQHSAARHTSG